MAKKKRATLHSKTADKRRKRRGTVSRVERITAGSEKQGLARSSSKLKKAAANNKANIDNLVTKSTKDLDKQSFKTGSKSKTNKATRALARTKALREMRSRAAAKRATSAGKKRKK